MRYEENKVCGTCKHNKYNRFDDGVHKRGSFSCNNERSEFCGDYTEYDDTCDEWEEEE